MTRSAFVWLIRDVFLRARATGFEAVLLLAVGLSIWISTALRYDAASESLRLLDRWPLASGPTARAAGGNYLFMLAFGAAEVAGVFLTLIAASGFLPTFLEPASATVMLSKPIRRWQLLLTRCLGVIVFVTFHSGLFVAGNAVAIALTTGYNTAGYWLCWPLLVVQFTTFFAFASLIAVATRNVIATMLGGIFFWLISWGISFGRQFLAGAKIEGTSPGFGRLVEYVYWVLPKPTDFSLILYDAMGVQPEGLSNVGLRAAQEMHLYSPSLAIVSSLLIAAVFYGLAAFELHHQDY